MLRSLTARRTLPVALLAAGALLLAGCGGDDKPKAKDPTESATPTPTSTPAPVADADNDGCLDFKADGVAKTVKVSGAFNTEPKVTFTKPLKAGEVERAFVTRGTGPVTVKGQEINTRISAFKGSDGAALGSQEIPITVGDSSMVGAFGAGVDCVPLRSRVVVTVSAVALYGPEGNPGAGIEAGDSVIVVTDVIGKVQPLKVASWTGVQPKVDFSGDTPKLTLPPGKPSTKLMLKVLSQGKGAVVKKGATVTVRYQGTNWNKAAIFDQSYPGDPAEFQTTGVVKGFGAALEGQKVGTKLVVTIPAEYGYGAAGNAGAQIAGTDTIVFIIEIVATA